MKQEKEEKHFASFMDLYRLKNAELETKHQKYTDRVLLRGDIGKDDSGSYAVFTDQGSSASRMTTAKVMDVISRLLGCDGQAVNTIYPEPEIHEHIYVTKRLRNNVQDCKHILTDIETNVTNNVNNTTHTDELTVQH